MNTSKGPGKSRIRRRLPGLAIIILLVPIWASGQRRETDSKDDELKERARKTVVQETRISERNGQTPDVKADYSYVTTYDAAGNRLRYETYYQGKLWQANDYSEIDGDRVVKETENPENGPQRPTIHTVSSGKQSVQPPRDERYTHRFKYTYDKSGNRIEVVRLSNSGSLSGRDVRVYDDKGNRTKESNYAFNGDNTFTTTFSYDIRGNLIHKLSHSHYLDSDTSFSYSYVFDRKGNWTKQQIRIKFTTKEGKTSELTEVSQRQIEYD